MGTGRVLSSGTTRGGNFLGDSRSRRAMEMNKLTDSIFNSLEAGPGIERLTPVPLMSSWRCLEVLSHADRDSRSVSLSQADAESCKDARTQRDLHYRSAKAFCNICRRLA